VHACYLKQALLRQYVFDWSWADTYRRHGQHYYPKLLSAVPFTPAAGPRLLLAEGWRSRTWRTNCSRRWARKWRAGTSS
jgi:hypothetical protein